MLNMAALASTCRTQPITDHWQCIHSWQGSAHSEAHQVVTGWLPVGIIPSTRMYTVSRSRDVRQGNRNNLKLEAEAAVSGTVRYMCAGMPAR